MKKTAFILLLITIVFVFVGCIDVNPIPTVEDVQQKYNTYSEYIGTVTTFLSTSQYENIYIPDTDGMMMADLADIKIDDTAVVEAVNILLKNNYKYISKRGNTIYIQQWRSVHERDCGIAYSINGIDQPDVQFMTECIPLDKDGWFYYVADYNLWRTQHP